jgi:NDP-sugar pyrophosphorylase family protein
MRAVILAGGKGTRLAPYTTVLPKPLVPVGDRPILAIVLEQLARHGFERIDISVGHLGELIKAYFDEIGGPKDVELHYSWETKPLGTAGALRDIEGLEDQPFLAMNGDILTTLNYSELMKAHISGEAPLTIATHRENIPMELGVIESDNGRVTGYREKPTVSFDVSMGIYAYHPKALEFVPGGQHFDFPDVVLAMLEAGEEVSTFVSDARWFDIGTRDQHEAAVAEIGESPELYEQA